MVDLRILIVADDPLARAGLAALLADQSGIAVIGQAAGDDLSSALDVYRPDVIVWDVGWESAPGGLATLRGELENLGEMGASAPAVIVLLPEAALAAEVWALGPRGLLLRDAPAERLIAALGAAGQGIFALDPALAESLMRAAPFSGNHLPPADDLTPRELEVLHLLAEGLPNKTIARQLGISEHTVKFHINALMGKLGAQSRTDAVVRATRQGLLIL